VAVGVIAPGQHRAVGAGFTDEGKKKESDTIYFSYDERPGCRDGATW
jgi:hypothetical protein